MGKQYIVFFGIGKTTWCKSHLNWVDLDVSWYTPIEAMAVKQLVYFYNRWDYNMLLGLGQFTAPAYMSCLNRYPGLSVNIIMPSADMKAEIVNRIVNRGGSTKEVRSIEQMYDSTFKILDTLPFDTKVYLKPGQYLSDIIDENGEYKPGVEVIYGNNAGKEVN